MNKELREAIKTNNRWYKNCKNVRRRGGLICKACPFRDIIETEEMKLGILIAERVK